MAQDPHLTNLLKWSIENSVPNSTSTDPSATRQPPSSRPIDPKALSTLFGGPSDADLMKASMATIQSSTSPLPEKLTAFDNFEQLIEQIDNANNIGPLGMWTPLIELLAAEETEIRKMAAWCVGTAVQNNQTAQERALVGGAIPRLVGMVFGAEKEEEESVKRKARYAISSLVRNYQPGMDAVVTAMEDRGAEGLGKIDAGDMGAVDAILVKLGR